MALRNVGKMGETTLELWSNQVGIVANPVRQDETGWDYILEFPLETSLDSDVRPFDHIWPTTVFVQVKSTDQRQRRFKGKLDNWLRLVHNPLPTFYLVLEFDGKETCQAAFLVHVGEMHIARVLKSLRESTGNNELLRSKYLSFGCNDSHKLPSMSGQGLFKAINYYVPDSRSYYSSKLKQLHRAGYDQNAVSATFNIELPNSYQDPNDFIVDFVLGLTKDINFSSGTFNDIRFGLESPLGTQGDNDGILTLENPSAGPTKIGLLSSDGARKYTINADTILPAGLGNLIPKKNLKARISASFLNLIYWLDPPRLELDFDLPDGSASTLLKDLVPVSRFLDVLDYSAKNNQIVRITLEYRGASLGTGEMKPDSEPVDNSTLRLVKAVLSGWIVSKHFEIHDTVSITPSSLVQQSSRLFLFGLLVGPSNPVMKINFWTSDGINDEAKEVCIPVVVDAILGKYRCVVSLACIGNPSFIKRSDKGFDYELVSTKVIIRRQDIGDVNNKALFDRDEWLDDVCDTYSESHNVIRMSDAS